MQQRTDTLLKSPRHHHPHHHRPTTENSAQITFYPAYCYQASPTWFTWVKLTAHDVHYVLESKPVYHNALNHVSASDSSWVYEKPGLYFYLNHPIQFVQLLGVVVSIEDHFEKFWLVTLDDSSGATIDVNCRKHVKSSRSDVIEDGTTMGRAQDEEDKMRTDVVGQLQVGMVVQVKGTISTFRDIRQLRLERLAVVPDTNREMTLIATRSEFWTSVLSIPWTLSQSQQETLLKLAHDDKEVKIHRASRKKRRGLWALEREKRHEKRLLERYEKDEVRRAACADAAKKAGELLQSQRSSSYAEK